MKLSDDAAWASLVYNLIYPGVLGSMIYDCVQVARAPGPGNWFYFTQIFIVILYSTDYLHLYLDLRSQDRKRGAWLIADGLIPVLFGVAYWSMIREDFRWLFVVLPIVTLLVLVYPCPPGWRRGLYTMGKALPFVFSLGALGLSGARGFCGGAYVAWTVGAIVVAYLVHVFVVTQLARQAT